ncbi:GTP-binding protein, partial [archaeon]|nr:GTP-binding protein [archaeon]
IKAAFPQYKIVGISARYGNNIEGFYDTLISMAG